VLVRRLFRVFSTHIHREDEINGIQISHTLEGDVSCAEELAVCFEDCCLAEDFWSRHDLGGHYGC